MLRSVRYLYAVLAWAFVASILLQVYFIGLGLFAGREYLELHVNFGWILHLVPIAILIAAPISRAGRRRIYQTMALAVTVWIVPILAALRADAPLAAAFHPVGALLAFLLAILVARGATSLLANPADASKPTTTRDWIFVALVVVILLFLSFSGSPDA